MKVLVACEKHGPIFAAHYLALVRAVLGVKSEAALKAAFKKHHVRFKPKRSLSPERKAALITRLAEYRAARGHERAARSVGGSDVDGPSTHPNVQRAGSPAHQSALALANSDTSYQ